jgi:type I restriction enzyme S subunit
MKPNSIDWIGYIPARWEVKPAKYILESNQKTLNETTKADYFFKYIDISSVDFDKGIIGYEEMNFENAPSRARRIVKKGDTIISTVRTYLKAITRIEDDKNVIVSTGFAVLSPKNNDPIFIEYYCKSDAFCSEIEKLSYGIAYPAINESVLINIKIILPPLKEQQAITAFLDTQCGRIDGIITEMEQQIEVLKQYKISLITETVTKGLDKSVLMKDSGIDWIKNIPVHWKIGKIKYAASFIGSGATPESSNNEYYAGDLNWIQSGDLYQNDYINETEKKITIQAVKEIPSLRLYKKPFLIIAMYGASVGNIAISNIDAYVNQACCCIIPDSKNNLVYFFYFFHASKNELLLQAVGGGQPNISQIIIKNIHCLLLPLKEQQAIAAFLDTQCSHIDNIIAEKRQSIETMRAYKKSLIYEYVTGKKRVKGYP